MQNNFTAELSKDKHCSVSRETSEPGGDINSVKYEHGNKNRSGAVINNEDEGKDESQGVKGGNKDGLECLSQICKDAAKALMMMNGVYIQTNYVDNY